MAELGIARIGGADLFCTLTLAEPPSTWAGFDHYGMGTLERRVAGWGRRVASVYPGVALFGAAEDTPNRPVTPHFHGILAGLGAEVAAAVERGRRRRGAELVSPPADGGAPRGRPQLGHARELIWGQWYPENGLARIEAPRSGDAAAEYAAKYTMKELGRFWVFEPGALRAEWQERGRRR